MCVALPARIVARGVGDEALIDVGGVQKTISLALVPEANAGDYVIVHVGYALAVLDVDEAERTLELFAEVGRAATSAS